jgi:uncharacterized protein YdbL (DUF1318 family)
MKKYILILLISGLNLYADSYTNSIEIQNNSMRIDINEALINQLQSEILINYMASIEADDANTANLEAQINDLTASLSSLQSSVTTNSASINDIVVNTSIPSSAVVIPTDASGPVQIILESSQDMINWNAANPGTYGASESDRFYRVRAVQQ